jgi:hypothetical protein
MIDSDYRRIADCLEYALIFPPHATSLYQCDHEDYASARRTPFGWTLGESDTREACEPKI